ncbi:MAG: hypothetical protein HY664_04765 [Chloroflexi bacterium]|nr:hypothetical protein [Chloroflexota bacterium]
MSDILEEAAALVQCKECPWYKSCVTPMKLTAEDIRRQLASTPLQMPGDMHAEGAAGWGHLLGELASAAQNLLLEGCPIFIQRLGASPELANRIKSLMQAWGRSE